MKTNQIVSTLLLCLIFLSFSSKGYTQDEKTLQYCENKEAAKQLYSAFETLHKTKNIVNWTDGKSCKSKDLMDKASNLYVSLFSSVYTVNRIYRNIKAPITTETFDKGFFMTLEDRALDAYTKSKDFVDFVSKFTGKNIGDIKGERKNEALGKTYKDIDAIRRYYNDLKGFFSQFDINVSHQSDIDDNCRVTILSTLKVKKFSYPKITWDLKTGVSVTCICNNAMDDAEVKSGRFEYTATSSGTFTHTKMTFGQPTDSKINIVSLECCGKKEKEEPISSEPQPEEIQDLMPDQSIGGGAGFGATQDFEDISYCVFAEYLKKINYGSDNGLYWGVEGSYSNSSFNDASSNRFNVGTKLQYHIPATQSQQTQYVLGIMGSYNFGTNDNGFSKDDVSGMIGCLYGGINIRVCEDWSVFGQFPIFIYENFTFKSESGNEFKTNGTSLLLNKDNPVKLGIRFHF